MTILRKSMAIPTKKRKKRITKNKERLFIVIGMFYSKILDKLIDRRRLVIAYSEEEAIKKAIKSNDKKKDEKPYGLDLYWSATEINKIGGYIIVLRHISKEDSNFGKNDSIVVY